MKIIKSYLMLTTAILSMAFLQAQDFRGPDTSPMDMAYYPDNYAHDRKTDEAVLIRVIYSRPQKKDREIFGKVVPYNKVWRTGANENTEIKLYRDAVIDGKKLSAGTYALFTIPGEKEWTIIFNADLDYWGSYSYQSAHDVLQTKVPVKALSDSLEYFSIGFEKNGSSGAIMKLGWDNTMIEVPFIF
ncbi:MAG: DUF2911 domain-containing protein [Saprospiraceae bacterium]|nr:DUF2911 domain-containing protein [Saprospiraceae bacterium]